MRRIDHVGIAVADLDEARRVWDKLLGQAPVVEEVPSQRVRTATYPCGIELVAPTSPESPIARFLEKRDPGMHHVTILVDDIRAELARLKAQGARLVNETPVRGAGGCPVAFLHPSAAGGVLVELKERK
jgi:methylmalonyl-CoA/ethylmalonyl-CoA epimerase